MSNAAVQPADAPVVAGYQIDPRAPLHQLVCHRIENGRDVKVIITAQDSQTGVGKTTLAGWLALVWTKMFTGQDWHVEPDEYGEGMATLHPREYFMLVKKVGNEYPAGTAIVVDDAEELDARRSMQHLNVDFSQRWMLMRLKQAITIITLPSPRAIDTRLEELSDVWINVERRGRALVHRIRVNSYGSRNVMTEQMHKITFPNVSSHPELVKLQQMKENKMDDWDDEEEDEQEEVDPDEVDRETRKEIAQEMRENGMTVREVAEHVGRSRTWVSDHTEVDNA